VEFDLRQKSIIWRLELEIRYKFCQSIYRSRIWVPVWREAPKLRNKSSNQGSVFDAIRMALPNLKHFRGAGHLNDR
jgi:hypothetical protein